MIPLLRKNSTFGQLYKYIYALMIALGASALFCDAVLHLLPEVLSKPESMLVKLMIISIPSRRLVSMVTVTQMRRRSMLKRKKIRRSSGRGVS